MWRTNFLKLTVSLTQMPPPEQLELENKTQQDSSLEKGQPNPNNTVDGHHDQFPPNPIMQYNFILRFVYEFMSPLIHKGFKKPLQYEDLYALLDEFTAKVLANRFNEIWATYEKPVSTLKVLTRQFGFKYGLIGIYHLIQAAANIASPTIIGLITSFALQTQTNPPGQDPPLYMGIVYAVIFFILQEITSLALARYFYHASLFGMKVKTTLTVVLYRKLMKLSSKARQEFSTGRVMTMISADLPRMEMAIMQLHYLWSGPLQIIVIIALLIALIGPSALVGFGLLVVTIPLQSYIFLQLATLRKATAQTTDARVRLTTEFLQGMRIIKFFSWEESFLKRIMDLRATEVGKIQYVNMWTAVLTGIAISVPTLASVVSFVVYAALGNALNAPIIFSALALFNILRYPLIILPNIIRSTVESKVALKRLDDFLNAEELEGINQDNDKSGEYAIEFDDASFKWETMPEAKKKDDKKDKTQPSEVVQAAAAEEVESSGKEKQADVIHLKNVNLKIKRGQLVAFIGQVGSGKSTLLCALLGEIKKISGNVSIHGSMGYSLQQPWIQNGTLKANILFGQPYDEQKYQAVIKASALEKDLEWLPSGDDTLLGEKGVQISGGQKARVSLARILYASPDIILLDDPLSAVDVHVGKHIFEEAIKKHLKDKTVLLVTHQLAYIREADYIVFMKEGFIKEQGTYSEIMQTNAECATLINSYVGNNDEDEEKEKEKELKDEKELVKKVAKKMSEEERAFGAVASDVYYSYIKNMGGPWMLALIIFLVVFGQLTRIGNDLWLVGWSSGTLYTWGLNDSSISGIYFAWGLSSGVMTSVLGAVLSVAFAAASNNFHNMAIRRVFRSPIKFFDNTPLGRIVNRFSKDTDVMDSTLPSSMQFLLTIFAGLISTLALMSYSVPLLLAPLGPIFGAYIFLLIVYIRSSRELKRMESISRSPVYSHVSESSTGLSTIRAYSKQTQFIDQLDDFVNNNNRAYYLQLMIQRWLGVRLEFFGALICFFTALFCVLGANSISGALIGIALSYSLQVTTSMNMTVRQAAEVEVNANSIERLHYYSKNLEEEAPDVIDSNRPPKEWPSKGDVEFKDLEVKYSADGASVLKKISFTIKDKEKIGIVGRTGAVSFI